MSNVITKNKFIKLFRIILFTFSFFILVLLGFRLWQAVEWNNVLHQTYPLSSEFTYSDLYSSFLKGGYRDGVPVKDMASQLEDYANPVDVVASEGPFTQETLELPIDITYYAEPSGDTVALQLKKGEKVIVAPDPEKNSGWLEIGYGCVGYPDYTPGWRCVRPFMVEGSGEQVEELPYYYIPLQDLETIFRQYVKEINAQREAEGIQKIEDGNGSIAQWVLSCDYGLYKKGIFHSPDLQQPLWDMWDTALVCAFALLFLGGLLLLAAGRKKRKILP